MNNYEVLKETKIIYEYINDLLTNGNFEINDDKLNQLEQIKYLVQEMYENTYNLMYKDSKEYEELKTNLSCPCCTNNVLISDLIDYAYVCDRCDENYYLCEGDLNHEWYFEDRKDEKLEEDFNLEISYDADKLNIIIGTESSSGAEYECRNISDLRKAITSYAYNYINYDKEETYSIKIWETEELRNQGLSFDYLETYNSKDNAIEDAKRIMDRFGYAYLEVINDRDESVVFGTDGNEEEYYDKEKYYNKIYKISSKELGDYVNKWTNKEKLNYDYDLLYCKEENGQFIAVDNRNGNCFVEEFDTEAQAVFWLDTDLSIEEVRQSIIPKDIIEKIIDTTKGKEEVIENEL